MDGIARQGDVRHGSEHVAQRAMSGRLKERSSEMLPSAGSTPIRRRATAGWRQKADAGAASDDLPIRSGQPPVPSVGGRFMTVVGRALRSAAVLDRQDVLVYTTPPLDKDVEVTRTDRSRALRRLLQQPTPTSRRSWMTYTRWHVDAINHGIQRAHIAMIAVAPGSDQAWTSLLMRDSVWPTSNLFKAGHQMRLEISSSNFRYSIAIPMPVTRSVRMRS